MNHITPIDRHDPHYVPPKSEAEKANTFFLIGLILMGVSCYIGYLIGRY